MDMRFLRSGNFYLSANRRITQETNRRTKSRCKLR